MLERAVAEADGLGQCVDGILLCVFFLAVFLSGRLTLMNWLVKNSKNHGSVIITEPENVSIEQEQFHLLL